MICLLVFGWLLSAGAAFAGTGWDQDDFIISGAPNFPDRIGIFDHDFKFKGYLETNFLGVQGMDFDAAGRLVALSSINPEVRVYDPNGNKVGGFTQASSPSLAPAGDLKVAPDGNYILGTNSNGARLFTPQGAFLRQYGSGDSRSVVIVPGNQLWSGGGANFVNIFDFDSGAQSATFTLDQQAMAYSMTYSALTNTVLIADYDLSSAFERALDGTRLRRFEVPEVGAHCYSVIRGPGGDVFGTALDQDVVRWLPDATYVESIHPYSSPVHPVRILWAGAIPEPSMWFATMIGACLVINNRRFCRRRDAVLSARRSSCISGAEKVGAEKVRSTFSGKKTEKECEDTSLLAARNRSCSVSHLHLNPPTSRIGRRARQASSVWKIEQLAS